jgi:hypothetical protein
MTQKMTPAQLLAQGYRVHRLSRAGEPASWFVTAPGDAQLADNHATENAAWKDAEVHFHAHRQKPVPVLFRLSKNDTPMALFPTIQDSEGWIYGFFGADRFEWAPPHFPKVYRRAPAAAHKQMLDAIVKHFDDPTRAMRDRFPVIPVTKVPAEGDPDFHWSKA